MIQDKVTIYIPTFNRCDLLKRAIDSVRAQSYKNIEILVVDDCSTDGTHDYLKSLIFIDPRIKLFIKDNNSGAPHSRNIAIQNATGKFITGLDDDDYFTPDRIEKFVENIHLLDQYVFLYSNYCYEKEGVIYDNKMNNFKQPRKLKFKDLLLTNYVGNQIFTYTHHLKVMGGFDVKLNAWQDLELWLRLLNSKNKSAKFLNHETYIVNKNFDIPRITLRNKGPRICESFEHISKKLKLKTSQHKILSMQMINYGVDIPLLYLIHSLFNIGLTRGFIYNLLFLVKKKFNSKAD